MRWARGLAPLLALALVLVGCTGTTQNVPPLLLAVGRLDPSTGNPEMTLIEDNYPNQPRLTVVPNSQRSLPYDAVASDVTDRASLSRASGGSDLVVLTRDKTGADSALVVFDLSGIDPVNATSAFTKLSTLQLTGGTNPVFPATGSGSGPWCFSAVSVSLTGRYAYLIDDPNACTSSPSPPGSQVVRLYQVDTTTRAVTQIPNSPLQATAPYDDQAQTGEQLYYLVSGTTDAQLYSVPVPFDPATESPSYLTTMSGTSQLALESNGTALLSVTNDNPYGTPTTSAASNLESVALPASGSASSVPTVNSAQALAVDPSGTSSDAVVPGYQQIFVHGSPSDTTPASTASAYDLSGVAAVIDPVNSFGYVLNDGYMVLLDLLNAGSSSVQWYTSTTTPGSPTYLPATELALPQDAAGRYLSVLAWTRAKTP